MKALMAIVAIAPALALAKGGAWDFEGSGNDPFVKLIVEATRVSMSDGACDSAFLSDIFVDLGIKDPKDLESLETATATSLSGSERACFAEARAFTVTRN